MNSVINAEAYYKQKAELIEKEINGYNSSIQSKSNAISSNDASIAALASKEAKTPEEAEKIEAEIASLTSANSNLSSQIDDLEDAKEEAEIKQIEIKEKQETIKQIKNATFVYPDSTGMSVTFISYLDDKKTGYRDDFIQISDKTLKLLTIVDQTGVDKGFKSNQSGSPVVLQSNKQWVQGTISNQRIGEIYNYLTETMLKLEEASEALRKISSSLNGLLEMVDSLNAARDTWQQSTQDPEVSDTSLAKQNAEEIKINKEFIKKEEVQDLITRVDHSKAAIDNLLFQIREYTYYGKPIVDLASLEDFITLLEDQSIAQLEQPPLDTAELDKFYTETIYSNCKEPAGSFESVYLWESASGVSKPWKEDCHPILDNEDRSIDAVECNFYQYLRYNFKSEISVGDAKKDTEDVSDKVESNLTKTGDASYDKENSELVGEVPILNKMSEIAKANDYPSKEWKKVKEVEGSSVTADSDGFFTAMDKLFASMGDGFGGLAETFRDNIYISDYILSMFTYKTYEKELYWEIIEKQAKGNGGDYQPPDVFDAFTVPSPYTKSDTGYSLNTAFDVKDGYFQKAKSLTNVPMTPDFHKAYLNEVEYIIYGDEGKGVNNTIFGIRLAFNTIYAFTSSEIRDGAYSIAVAVFGTPPLTFLVPVAKIAIIIAVAIAESCLDMKMLNEGLAVPLYKSSDTWILSFSSLSNQMMNVAKDAVIKVSNKAVDTAASKLGALINDVDGKLQKVIDGTADDVNELIVDVGTAIDEEITRCTDAVMNQVVELCNDAVIKTDELGKINGMDPADYVLEQVNTWIEKEFNTVIHDEGHRDEIQKAVFQALKENTDIINKNIVEDVLSNVKEVIGTAETRSVEFIQSISKQTQDAIMLIRTKVSKLVIESADAISDYKNAAIKKINDGIAKGSDQLKESISEVINGQVMPHSKGTSVATSGKQSTSHASFFSFHYSDYLRLFLLIGLTMNEETLLLRTADVMQANMRHVAEEKYLLSDAYAYVTLHVKAKVPPLVMTLPWMTNMTSPYLEGDDDWYTITYDNTIGY